ncbi:O-antigen polymerase [Rheinheimera sp. FR7-31]|uniref:O-antigen polymerase n=1 Tax=Rheinheimera fenheensis TaxID=3152295 RepID=UPI00325C8A29
MRYLIINPLSVFTLTWLSVVLLYSARWSDVLIIDSWFIVFFVISFVLSPFMAGFSISYFIPVKKGKDHGLTRETIISSKRLKLFAVSFVVVTFIEIAIFKGFPVLWFLVGDSRGYADYGIPTVHGLVNAMHLSLITISFYLAIKRRVSWVYFFILIIWCVLMFSRFLIMVSIVQCLFLYFLTSNVRFSRVLITIFFGFAFIYLFGLIGGMRSGIEDTAQFFGVNENFPDFLPVVFIWVYIYLLSPINNLASWYGYVSYDFTFPSVFATLLPSVIRDFLYSKKADDSSLPLVHEAFNMSTGLAPAFADAGIIGMLIFLLFFGFASGILWRLSKGLTNYFSLAVMLQCVFYLVFFNPLFTLPILFQFFIFRFLISYKVINH